MATLARDPWYRPLTAEEFVELDLGDAKAELQDGAIYMMAGGSAQHARTSGRVFLALSRRLDGTGCEALGSDMAVKTHEQGVRYPDVSVYCGQQLDLSKGADKLIGDPRVVVEVLSPSTATHDQVVKLAEYQAMSGIDTILFVDPEQQRVRVVQRAGPASWTDKWLMAEADLAIPSINILVPTTEFFAVG